MVMVHRRRSAHRPTQSATAHHENVRQSKTQLAKQCRPKAIDLSDSESVQRTDPTRRVHDADTDPESDDGDIDAPRVAQWIDDEDLELQEPSSSDVSDSVRVDDHGIGDAGPSQRLRSLQDDLSTLPLGTLRNAQRSLALAHALSDSEPDSEEQSEDASEDNSPHQSKGKPRESPTQLSKQKNCPAKRTNKHAPAEITSKRPVSRRRVVVDDKLPKPRDPRFIHATGRYESDKFKKQYEFLSDIRRDELTTLREHVKRARKLVAASPSHLRAEREEVVKRLEKAIKTSESAVNLDDKDRVELKALQFLKQTEKEKRKQGKAEWWLKRSARKELLAKARLDATASVGGKRAVKKAMEKKQKKINQKEKKRRPFSWNDGIEQSLDGKKRRPVQVVDSGRVSKRRKLV